MKISAACAKEGKPTWIKAVVLVVFVVTAIILVRFTPVARFLEPAAFNGFLKTTGMWGPVTYILVFVAGVCLFIPASLLVVLGGVAFGAYWGFLYALAGVLLGSTLSFWIGRSLGREFIASVIGERLRKYDEAIRRHGFATVLYLRLLYLPFAPLNYGMGLTRVHFRDFFWGTALGVGVEAFIMTYFTAAIKEVWGRGDWSQFFNGKILFSVGLFIFSFFIPRIISRINKLVGFVAESRPPDGNSG
jgi:uncharacterized membrane protein YdjX (TVP38/TMEM64 family)